MSRHERYCQQRVIPCACGSTDAYWHGHDEVRRDYCCDACYLAEHERLGTQCVDGGACHHTCTARCFRREQCGPLSGYHGPWDYTDQPMVDDVGRDSEDTGCPRHGQQNCDC